MDRISPLHAHATMPLRARSKTAEPVDTAELKPAQVLERSHDTGQLLEALTELSLQVANDSIGPFVGGLCAPAIRAVLHAAQSNSKDEKVVGRCKELMDSWRTRITFRNGKLEDVVKGKDFHVVGREVLLEPKESRASLSRFPARPTWPRASSRAWAKRR
jgi:hypothetical protein